MIRDPLLDERYIKLRKSAGQRGKIFELGFERFCQLQTESCHYCGGEVETTGLDRVDPSDGYKDENVVRCCIMCNMGKHIYAAEAYLAHCRKVVEYQNKLNANKR